MGTVQLIASLLGLLAQYGPDLVHTVTDLIKGNPQLQGETDDAYIARINPLITAKLDDAAAKDKQVEEG